MGQSSEKPMELKRLTSIITSRLAYLSSEVRLSGSMNLLDSNVLLEDVFKEILNITYGLKLQNANLIKQNIRAIDLIDCSSKTIIQVSSDNSKAKVQTSLDKIEQPKYEGYTFKFVCISKGVSHLKKHHFNVPEGISFNAEKDSYDDKRILRDVLAKDIDTIRKLALYLEKSILPATADERRPSVITYVINRLADEPLAEIAVNPDTKSFDLKPKIDFNSLKKWRDIISEYTVFSLLVDKIYRAYDEQGVNKSFAVLSSLHDLYLNLASELTGDALFDKLLESVYDIVNKDYEYNESLTREELQMNIKIVVVDAFVKCKIFKKPE